MMRAARRQLRAPIFRVTSLGREIAECYSVLGLGFILGLAAGAMIVRLSCG